jgi:hypothetical protein
LRRFSAILLLALISLWLLSPAIGSGSDANLPACCRLNGKHHCSMQMGGGASQSGAGFKANGKCPMYPPAVLSSCGSFGVHIPRAVPAISPDRGRIFRTERDQSGLRIFRARAHQQRGPPFNSFIVG